MKFNLTETEQKTCSPETILLLRLQHVQESTNSIDTSGSSSRTVTFRMSSPNSNANTNISTNTALSESTLSTVISKEQIDSAINSRNNRIGSYLKTRNVDESPLNSPGSVETSVPTMHLSQVRQDVGVAVEIPQLFISEGLDFFNREAIIPFPRERIETASDAEEFSKLLIKHSELSGRLVICDNINYEKLRDHANIAFTNFSSLRPPILEAYRSSAFNFLESTSLSSGILSFLSLFPPVVLSYLAIGVFNLTLESATLEVISATFISFLCVFRPLLTTVVDVRLWASHTLSTLYYLFGKLVNNVISSSQKACLRGIDSSPVSAVVERVTAGIKADLVAGKARVRSFPFSRKLCLLFTGVNGAFFLLSMLNSGPYPCRLQVF